MQLTCLMEMLTVLYDSLLNFLGNICYSNRKCGHLDPVSDQQKSKDGPGGAGTHFFITGHFYAFFPNSLIAKLKHNLKMQLGYIIVIISIFK